MKLITQKAPMGCAIACSASLVDFSYEKMSRYFDNSKIKEQTSGFYNRDIIATLSKIGVRAKAYSIKRWGNKKINIGTIIFVKRSKEYPVGHYLLKTERGWMNPWINFPNITPAKAGFQKSLPGKINWVIETSV